MPKPDKLRRNARRALRRGETAAAARTSLQSAANEKPAARRRPPRQLDEADFHPKQRSDEEIAEAWEEMSMKLTDRFRTYERELEENPKLLVWRLNGLRDFFKDHGCTVGIDETLKPGDEDNRDLLVRRLEALRQDFERAGYVIPLRIGSAE